MTPVTGASGDRVPGGNDVSLLTSDRMADPATLAARVRGHWEIENKLRWVRDVT